MLWVVQLSQWMVNIFTPHLEWTCNNLLRALHLLQSRASQKPIPLSLVIHVFVLFLFVAVLIVVTFPGATAGPLSLFLLGAFQRPTLHTCAFCTCVTGYGVLVCFVQDQLICLIHSLWLWARVCSYHRLIRIWNMHCVSFWILPVVHWCTLFQNACW